jgi:hypothetical protein
MRSLPNQAVPAQIRWGALWVAIGWLLITAVVVLSLVSIPVDLEQGHSDKTGHVLAYAVLMFWFCQLYQDRINRLVIGAALLAMGCGLEVVQHAIGRHFEYFDMVAGAAGIAGGCLAAPPRSPDLLRWIEARFARKQHDMVGKARSS